MKRKLFNFAADIFIKTLFLNKANKLSCGFAEKLDPICTVHNNGVEYIFSCPNSLIQWRAETFFTKEPETIEWINTFKSDETLFDVGANIGLYSIYAAQRGIKVIAFEPESQNYALLNKNVYLNQCQDRMVCLNVALSDKDCIDYLYLPLFQAGRGINCFGEPLDEQGKTFDPVFRQGVLSYSMDSFLSQYHRFPDHIKIDVDGIESKIIKGSEKTFKNPKLKSLLIEINDELPEHLELVNEIQSAGLLLRHKKHADMFEEGKYSKIYNYVFTRT